MSQLLADAIKRGWENRTFSRPASPEEMMNKLGCAIGEVLKPYFETAVHQRALIGDIGMSLCKSLIAISVNQNPCLFQFDFNGAPERATKDLPFVALGSGANIADPFLALLRRLLWSEREPTVSEGRLAAVWTVEHVAKTNPGGVGGNIQLATLGRGGSQGCPITMATQQNIEEHLQRISTAENVLVAELRGTQTIQPPAIPTNPAK